MIIHARMTDRREQANRGLWIVGHRNRMDQSEQIVTYLSEATEQQLAPIQGLRSTSFLHVKLTDDGEDFMCEFRSLQHITSEEAQRCYDRGQSVVVADGREFIEIGHPPVGDVLKWFRRLPEKTAYPKKGQKKQTATKYRVTTTDFNALMISECWPEDKVLWTKGAKTTFSFLRARFASQEKRAKEHAEYKINKTMPDIHPVLLRVEERAADDVKLSPYQLFAAHLSLLQEGLAYFMDRGTGKTATAIRVMNAEAILHKQGKIGDRARMMRVLVVCPKQVRLNWQLEVEKFTVVPGKTMVLRGGQSKRIRQLIENVRDEADSYFSVTIISYDMLVNDVDALIRCKFDRVITDESHRFKGEKTDRWKGVKLVADSASRKLALTGTPICNGYHDLWTQLEFLGEGQSGFKRRPTFRKFFGKFEKIAAKTEGGWEMEKLVGMCNVPLLKERLTRMSFSISKEEAGLNLPEKVYDTWEITMTKKQADIYEQIKQNLKSEFENKEVKRSLSANHVLTRLLRLAQITAGFVTWDAEYSEGGELLQPKFTEQIDPGKNPKILSVLEQLADDTEPNEKVLIWSVNVEDIRALNTAINEAGYKCLTYYGATPDNMRTVNEDAFNGDPSVKVMICNPMSASEGLNLLGYNYRDKPEDQNDTWTGLEIFYAQNWSSSQRGQAEDRGHRRGTRKQVRIRDIVCPGTIDSEIREAVLNKIQTADELQDLSFILKAVLGQDFKDPSVSA